MENRIAEKIKPQPVKRRGARFVGLRARLPLVLRYGAIAALALTIIYVGVGYWGARHNRDFRMFGGAPELSTEVVAVVNGYERRVTEGDRLKMLVRADRETTYADRRHELDNIYLEVYPNDGGSPDRVTAAKAVYKPDEANPENFVVSFAGNVQFETRDNLKASTEQIVYDKQREIAETNSQINFSRENISGSAVGAVLHVKDKKLELKNQVEINVEPNGNLAKNSLTDFGASAVKINSQSAGFDQNLDKFELEGAVQILISPQTGQSEPTTIRAEKAVYEKDREKLDLSGNVEIVTASDNAESLGAANHGAGKKSESNGVPVYIRAAAASYERNSGKIHLNGGASVEQGGELMKGEAITANLNKQKKLEKLLTRGRAFLRTAAGERTTEVTGVEMFFQFGANQQIQTANVANDVKARSTNGENEINLAGANRLTLDFQTGKMRSLLEKMRAEGDTNVSLDSPNSPNHSQIQMFAPASVDVFFAAGGQDRSVLKQMQTGGRTEIKMFAPAAQAQNPKATNKRLIADSVKLFWNGAGKDLSRAEAVGNAELYVVPLADAAPGVEKQSLFGARFDCDFFEIGNLARTCAASGGARAVLEPGAAANRPARILTAEKLAANFQQTSQSVERVEANGNAKFNEGESNGTANGFSYSAGDETVRLRGGEPTIWDNRARLKATEIDWNRRSETSNLRGKVATTYYSREQTGGAAPFSKVNSPVFVTANAAEFNHAAGTAVYAGNARAWQDNNFVRAEKLILRRDSRSMYGDGKVQSALYNAKRRENGQMTSVPVFAASDRIAYSDANKLLRYESNVDIRQGTERITGGAAEVYLNERHEVERTLAQNSVVITQPGRKATGDWAQYTAADETVVLRGNPATVADVVQGSSQGGQVTVYMRENRIVGQGSAAPNAPGRVRSTHKIKKQ